MRLVVADNPNAGILDVARDFGVSSAVLHAGPWRTKLDPAAEAELVRLLRVAGVELIVLAGFMRILKTPVLDAFAGRIINIHPSLLPQFPGKEAWTQALAAGATVTGCTVHFVDSGIDTGEIIAQREVEILPNDTASSFHERIQAAERKLFPAMCTRAVRPSVVGNVLPRPEGARRKGCEMAVSALAVDTRRGSASRLLPLGGVVFVALVLVAFVGLGGDTPGSGDSAATINAFYDAHRGNSIAAALLVAAAAPFLVLFGVSLAAVLWPTDAGRRPFWQIMLAGGSAVGGAGWIIAAFVHLALVDAADQRGHFPGGALQALNVLDANSWVAFNSGMGVLLLGAGGALIARRVHVVLGWVALAIGILLFIPYADFAGLILSGLWVIVTSVQLYRRGPAFAD